MTLLKDVNLNNLYYFHVIANAGSLTKAGKILSVSQPTLSQQLKQLEEQFSQNFFDRKGKSLVLNPHGKQLLNYTSSIFDQLEEFVTKSQYNSQLQINFHFQIGIVPSISRNYAAKILKPLFEMKNLMLSIQENDVHSLLKKLRTHDLDFIFLDNIHSDINLKGIETFKIGEIDYTFICGPNFKYEIHDIPHDLKNVPYLKYNYGHLIQEKVDNLFLETECFPKIIAETDDLNIMIAATQSDYCVSLVPTIAVDRMIEGHLLKKLGSFSQFTTEIYAVILSENTNDDIKSILENLRSYFTKFNQ